MNELVPRQTVEMIVANRDKALALFEQAFSAIEQADEAISTATKVWSMAAPKRGGHYSSQADEIQAFYDAVKLPKKERYLHTARKLIDCSVWDHIITTTELERLMDKQAKDELRAQMKYVPDRVGRDGELITDEEAAKGLPEVTVGNITATLEKFAGEADMIFKRGLANAFSKLDRRFRSHNGFRIGDRVILTHCFDDSGHWWHTSHHRDTIMDIERTFQVLDGQDAMANYQGVCWTVDQERNGWNAYQSEHEGEFFKIRIFKNGNAHLWFTRKDLLDKANKILGEWYGEVVGDGETQEEDPLNNPKTSLAKNYGFFPTPDKAADLLFDYGWQTNKYWFLPDNPKVLEPSAGTGQLAWRAGEKFGANNVDCVEIQAEFAEQLEAHCYNKVICADFLSLTPESKYDAVVMNPPFDRERDIDHVVWAIKFLKPGGHLHAIMSAGTEYRQTKKSIAFRNLMKKMGAHWEDLPVGSFSESGTNVNTIILRVTRPGKVE